MENKKLKNFFKEYKEFLIETDHSANSADQYCTYLRKTCALLNLGEGFLEAIYAIADVTVKASLCEFLMAKLSNEFKCAEDKTTKKHISNYKSAVSALTEFVAMDEESTDGIVDSFLPAVEMPFESVYDKKMLINIFKSRLGTQERYYYADDESFSARVLNKIVTKEKRPNIYEKLILETKFLYEADNNKFFRLSEISKLIIKTDGYVKIEVKGKEYDVYTQVYVKGNFVGFELLRVDSVRLISLDHVHSVHEIYPEFLDSHDELHKLSKNMIKHRRKFPEMRNDEFAKLYFKTIYPDVESKEGVSIDNNLLIDQAIEFIEKLELLIVHKSYNSSKSDSVVPSV